jgi:hypothetical protein
VFKDAKHPSYRRPRGEISRDRHGTPRVVEEPSSASQDVSIVVKLCGAQVDEVVRAASRARNLLVAGVERGPRTRCYKLTRPDSVRVGVAR